MRVIQPPYDKFFDSELRFEEGQYERPWVFLAGSIEQDKADRWQDKAAKALKDLKGTLWNPRRDKWDATWEQSMSNPHFVEQVEWELDGLDKADIVLMYFDPATKSPITLLELGLLKEEHGYRVMETDVVVCCPEGFWRKGNVDIVSYRMGVQTAETLDEMLAFARRRIAGFVEGQAWVDLEG